MPAPILLTHFTFLLSYTSNFNGVRQYEIVLLFVRNISYNKECQIRIHDASQKYQQDGSDIFGQIGFRASNEKIQGW